MSEDEEAEVVRKKTRTSFSVICANNYWTNCRDVVKQELNNRIYPTEIAEGRVNFQSEPS